ncbi:MAG: putative peptidoglycan lipid flippase [Actinomycetota bacterium]|jgi:putative peptidoglycan lipid II flippase|nr:putative peptidoglycan lipid flippase [Actinomycetota bacterium]
MTALTAVSRITGFVRILVVAAVLGDTFLGNTYQSANTVPNLLFEIFAAGVLQAVLIPTLVELDDAGRSDESAHVARSVLGLAGAGLGALAAVGMLLAPLLMRVLVSGVDSAAVRDDEVRLGTVLLLLFLPQVVMYAAGMVATAVLNARHRFALPVFAPTINNIVVTGSYGLFWILRDGKSPSLHLSPAEVLVLGGGTTLGVIAFCALPIAAAVRAGVSLRPSFDRRNPYVRRIARRGVWAAAFLGATQVLLGVVLLLANGVVGGVVQYQVAFTVFLLPHALFALPVLTALFPTMARHHAAGDDVAFGRTVGSGLAAITYLVLLAVAAMVALADPVAHAIRFAEFSETGAAHVAGALRAFGPGLLGYGAFLFVARAFYATGDTKTPAAVNACVVAVAAVAMVLAVHAAGDDDAVAAIAAVHSAAYLAGAIALLVQLERRHSSVVAGAARTLGAAVVAAILSGSAMWLVQGVVPGSSRTGAVAEIVLGGAAGIVVYVVAAAALGGPRPSSLPALLRGHGTVEVVT